MSHIGVGTWEQWEHRFFSHRPPIHVGCVVLLWHTNTVFTVPTQVGTITPMWEHVGTWWEQGGNIFTPIYV